MKDERKKKELKLSKTMKKNESSNDLALILIPIIILLFAAFHFRIEIAKKLIGVVFPGPSYGRRRMKHFFAQKKIQKISGKQQSKREKKHRFRQNCACRF